MKKGLLSIIVLVIGLAIVPACKKGEKETMTTKRMKKTTRVKRMNGQRVRRERMEQTTTAM